MKPRGTEAVYFWFFRAVTFLTIGLLLLVLGLLWYQGHGALSWDFVTAFWNHQDITEGGIFPAILGSLLLGLGVVVFSFQMGVATAIIQNQ